MCRCCFLPCVHMGRLDQVSSSKLPPHSLKKRFLTELEACDAGGWRLLLVSLHRWVGWSVTSRVYLSPNLLQGYRHTQLFRAFLMGAWDFNSVSHSFSIRTIILSHPLTLKLGLHSPIFSFYLQIKNSVL